MNTRPASQSTPPWYESWFHDKRYLELYEHRDDEEADQLVTLIEHTIGRKRERKILDVACGAGRHLIAFAKRGYTNLHGQDLSQTLIDEGRIEAQAYPITFSVRDMRDPILEQYDLILNIFTSFGYFASDQENEQVIENCTAALSSGGHFVLDYFSRQHVLLHLIKADERVLPNGAHVHQRREVVNGRVIKHIQFDDGTEFIESVRLYEKEEIEAMFKRSGLVINATFGSYDGEVYNKYSSPRLILFGHKP